MGRLDIGLNQTGCQQVEALGKRLHDYQIGRIITSPLGRCRETAAMVGRRLNVPVAADARLVERDIGELEGKSKAGIFMRLEGRTDNFGKKVYTEVPPGGESAEEVRARVFSLMDELRRLPGDGNILIITHSFVAKMIYKYFHPNISDKEFFSWDLKEADVIKFSLERN